MTNNTEVTVTQALEPCPRCNNRAFMTSHPYAVWCVTDRCLRLPPRETPEEAASDWNTRARHRTRSDSVDAVREAKPPLKMLVDDEWLQKRIDEDEDEAVREGEAVRLMRAYYAAENARNDCPECENEGPWEHCEPCSERIGNAINDQLLFLASLQTQPAAITEQQSETLHEAMIASFDEFVPPVETQPAARDVVEEPFGYWVEQKHAEPVLLRKPAYIPEPNERRTVTPLYAKPNALRQATEIEWRGTEDQQHEERMKACRDRRACYPDDDCDRDGSCSECEMDMAEALELPASKERRANATQPAGEGS